MTSVSLPKTCAQKFLASELFTYNRDTNRRDALLKQGADVHDAGIGVVWFEGASLELIAQLFEEKFIDPFENQNDSPTSLDFLSFMCEHPYVLAAGHAVSASRDDYRVTLESLTIPAQFVTPSVQADFLVFSKDADEQIMENDLYCWWD